MSALSEALNAANVEGWSAREIARRSGDKVSHSVVADYINGRQARRPKEYVLAAFAEVFPSLTVQRLRELAGVPAGELEPWEPPAEADRLSSRQRDALSELIRAIAADQERTSGGDVEAAPMIRAEAGSEKTQSALAATMEMLNEERGKRRPDPDVVQILERRVKDLHSRANREGRRRSG